MQCIVCNGANSVDGAHSSLGILQSTAVRLCVHAINHLVVLHWKKLYQRKPATVDRQIEKDNVLHLAMSSLAKFLYQIYKSMKDFNSFDIVLISDRVAGLRQMLSACILILTCDLLAQT